MKDLLEFLTSLRKHNYKEWFDAHKQEYKEVKATFDTLALQLIDGIASFDPSIRGLEVKNCTYRIYRDVRFSANKAPYKTHMGVFVAPHGKCSGYAGYYFHVEPSGGNYLEGHLLCSGAYMPTKEDIKSVREDILCHPEDFQAAVEAADGFTLDTSSALKKCPPGYPPQSPYIDWLKLRNYLVTRTVDDSFLLSPYLLDNLLNEFKRTQPFVQLINRSIEYARNE